MIYFLAATQMSLSEVVGIKLMGLELKLKGGQKNSLVKVQPFKPEKGIIYVDLEP